MRRPDMKKGWLLALDPGLRQGGVAILEDSILRHAGPVQSGHIGSGYKAWEAMARAVQGVWIEKTQSEWGPNHFVAERMVVRARGGSTPEDLIQVTSAAAWTAGLFSALRTPNCLVLKPEEIKAQLPKKAARTRVEDALSAAEKKVIAKANADLTEDIFDALYIGLWAVGRVG